jgi:hypothetical protein
MTPTSIRFKQELYSIAQAFVGLAILALVLAGIGGTIYKVISPEGWRARPSAAAFRPAPRRSAR